jgi:hypothetical protein
VGALSVLVDPLRALRMLGRESGRPFSSKVLYVYGKQLEEADLIVINKCDLLDEERAARLESALRERYGGAEILRVSAREGTGLDRWLAALAAEAGSPAAPQVDYDLYAEGEALLGWLNSTVRVSAPMPFDGNRFLLDLGGHIRRTLAAEGVEIAHLKMTLARDGGTPAVAVLNLVASGSEPELRYALEAPLAAGTLTVNLRAESAPEALRGAVEAALTASGPATEVRQLAYFHPARPVPTHRMADG